MSELVGRAPRVGERGALQPLATALGATVVAHDSPGFGLTERSEDLSRYTPKHNARISRAMLGVAERRGWRKLNSV